MSKFECDLVADLLPIYIDGKASEATKEFIEEHIKTCQDCRDIYEAMTADMELSKPEKRKKKFKIPSLLKILLVVLGYLVFVIVLIVIINYILMNGVF
ncbi:zf-HC2 domain-containing protein [Pseudobutyrivibrio xylanivorans]|uniref:Zf-HC2 domain-containing protein n=1 Tax=Pseudobutyrivibrio xylanivorans TaxID=185007 RepID=A0A5P6VNX7_PSEXY|nr:zf-HC2 domain-containing protein [Pseudobutyrivibrio xylanivorans]QFJ54058.1 zf-HC2 domain-containing protein [Pseudobutyrivibrio xylanivorans]